MLAEPQRFPWVLSVRRIAIVGGLDEATTRAEALPATQVLNGCARGVPCRGRPV